MTEFYAFAAANPVLTFFLGFLVMCTVIGFLSFLEVLIRGLNVWIHGWPEDCNCTTSEEEDEEIIQLDRERR